MQFEAFLWGLAHGLVVALGVGVAVTSLNRDAAIERGHALYCPTTGDFAWKGECDQ